jgi:molecular chaperone GrpE
MNADAQTNTEPMDDDVVEQGDAELQGEEECSEVVEQAMTPEMIEAHLASDDCSSESQRCIEQLITEVIAATEARQRALADFKNFQRRASEEEQRMTRIATANAFRVMLPVLDQLQMAIQQDVEAVTGEQILEGVRIAGDELLKILCDHGVSVIEPEPGDEFEPLRHEAMMNMASDEHDSGCIVQVLQVGFLLGEQVLRPAKVSVAS